MDGIFEPAPIQVLLLGTYHFANPGHDLVKLSLFNHLAPVKQAEISAVVDGLARFLPTKVLVEYNASDQTQLQVAYRGYRDGKQQLGVHEMEQIGFRLAQHFQHDTVYAINEPADILLRELMEEARQRTPEFLASLESDIAEEAARMKTLLASTTVRETLRVINSPDEIRAAHVNYLNLVPFGAGDSFSGANVLSAWYARNIRIYANLMRHLVPGDRALVVYGAGHLATLRECLVGTPGVQVADTLTYL